MSDATLARRVIGLVEKLQSFIPLLAYQAGLSGWHYGLSWLIRLAYQAGLSRLAYQAGLSSWLIRLADQAGLSLAYHSLFLNKLHLTLIINP